MRHCILERLGVSTGTLLTSIELDIDSPESVLTVHLSCVKGLFLLWGLVVHLWLYEKNT